MSNGSFRHVILGVSLCVMMLLAAIIIYSETRVPDCTKNLPAGFVDIKSEIPGISVDIRYATRNNFVGEVLEGYEKNCAWGLREMVAALKKVSSELYKRGYRLKVYDAYRPMSAEWHMIRWALKSNRRHLLGIYVPGSLKPLARFGHTCGNMIDVTLADISGKKIDMGTDFDEFTTRSHTFNAKGAVKSNRLFLKRIMEKYGFKNYSKEWWHFTYGKKGHAALNDPIR